MGHQQGGHSKHLAIPVAITLHHLAQQMFSAGTHMAEENMLSYMGIDFLVRRLSQLKLGKPEREDKNTGNKRES